MFGYSNYRSLIAPFCQSRTLPLPSLSESLCVCAASILLYAPWAASSMTGVFVIRDYLICGFDLMCQLRGRHVIASESSGCLTTKLIMWVWVWVVYLFLYEIRDWGALGREERGRDRHHQIVRVITITIRYLGREESEEVGEKFEEEFQGRGRLERTIIYFRSRQIDSVVQLFVGYDILFYLLASCLYACKRSTPGGIRLVYW